MSPDLTSALQRASTLYLTTYSRTGQSGTVPIWFFLHEGAIYFCTQRGSLKVRRLRQTGRATLHIGRRSGPCLACTAQILDDDPDLQALLVRTYRKRYWFRWLFLGPRLRRAFARGEEILVRLTPTCPVTPPGRASA
jgi:PPOX class probable F420-dependent enzyme